MDLDQIFLRHCFADRYHPLDPIISGIDFACSKNGFCYMAETAWQIPMQGFGVRPSHWLSKIFDYQSDAS